MKYFYLIFALFILNGLLSPVAAANQRVLVDNTQNIIEIYHSGVSNNRVEVNDTAFIMWQVRWQGNDTAVTQGLQMIIKGNGTFGDVYLLAHYDNSSLSWNVDYSGNTVGVMNFSVFMVDCYGNNNFVQSCDDVQVIWDTIVVNTTTLITDEALSLQSVIVVGVVAASFIIILAVCYLSNSRNSRYRK